MSGWASVGSIWSRAGSRKMRAGDRLRQCTGPEGVVLASWSTSLIIRHQTATVSSAAASSSARLALSTRAYRRSACIRFATRQMSINAGSRCVCVGLFLRCISTPTEQRPDNDRARKNPVPSDRLMRDARGGLGDIPSLGKAGALQHPLDIVG